MDLAPNGDLKKLISGRRTHQIDEDTLRSYAVDMVNALEFLHQRNILHRYGDTPSLDTGDGDGDGGGVGDGVGMSMAMAMAIMMAAIEMAMAMGLLFATPCDRYPTILGFGCLYMGGA